MEKSQKSELALRTAQLDALEESLRRMQANLEVVKQKQENLTIKAPIGGQITSLSAEMGQSKSAGQRLGQIDVLNGFKATATIDEAYLPRIEVGTAGRVRLRRPQLQARGQEDLSRGQGRQVPGRAGIPGRTAEGHQARPDPARPHRPGRDQPRPCIIPNGEYLKTTEGEWVYRLDETGKAVLKSPIKLGRKNAEAVEVAKGLRPGDRVIVSSYGGFAGRDKLVLKEK